MPDSDFNIRALKADLHKLTHDNPVDLKGRRIGSASDAVESQDYITKRQAEREFAPREHTHDEVTSLLEKKTIRRGTKANRGAAQTYPNTLYIASDWNDVTWHSDGATWRYEYGIYQRTQAQIAAVTAVLTTADAGLLLDITDYDHLLKWSGTAWEFAPGEQSGYIVVNGSTQGGVWGLCDGTAYNVLKGDGTTVSVTTPNMTGDAFILGATANDGAQRVAARATWEAAARTETEAAHTHSVNPDPATSGPPSATVEVQAGTGTTVSTQDHTHATDVTATTSAAGSAHSHTLVDANAQLKVPSEANGGVPLRIAVRFEIRR